MAVVVGVMAGLVELLQMAVETGQALEQVQQVRLTQEAVEVEAVEQVRLDWVAQAALALSSSSTK